MTLKELNHHQDSFSHGKARARNTNALTPPILPNTMAYEHECTNATITAKHHGI